MTSTPTRRALLAGLPAAAAAGFLPGPAAHAKRRGRGHGGPAAGADADARVIGIFRANLPWTGKAFKKVKQAYGRSPGLVMWFQAWGDDGRRFDAALLDRTVAHRAAPMVTWEPWDPAAGPDQPAFSLRAIADGDHDDYVDGWAAGMAQWGGPVWLRFAHEMNGDWYPWGAARDADGNRAADYVDAWRHLRDRFAQAGAGNVRWVWCPNVLYTGSAPLAALYPGDDAVDWIGMAGYNWATDKNADGPVHPWQTLAEVFGETYDALTAAHPGKPLLIAETACPGRGDDKADWIRNGFLSQIPDRLPLVTVATYFDQDKRVAGGNEQNWRASASKATKAAFSEVVRSPKWAASLGGGD